MVRSLGERGYGVELITIGAKREWYVSTSRYVKTHHALMNVKELTSFLLFRTPASTEKKEVIISCADVVTEHLNQFRGVLAPRYLLPGCDEQGYMVKLMDKTTMIAMAAARGLHAPEVWRLPEDKEKVTFPCITKSYVSSHGGKADVKIIRTREQLNEFIADCKDKIFAQRYIGKKEEVQFIGCSINGGEQIVIPGMTRIIRSQPNTNTGFLEYSPINPFYADTVERSKQFIHDCGYTGLFSIEFIRSNDDKVYFLEINFRNDGNAYCVTAAGVNLPVIWDKSCLGLDYSDELHEVKTIMVMPEFQDFKLVLQHKLTLTQWISDLKRTDAFFDWNRKDKRPFFRYLLNKI